MTPPEVVGIGHVEKKAPDADQRVQQLLALNRAAIAITGELELDSLLQRIVDAARELVGCKYAALGVLGDDGYITRFPTSGISEKERELIGAPPRGHGLLGLMLRAGRTLRIADMSQDPRRVGFPPHHPPMTSLLGVPIYVRGSLVGDLYLTDKIGGPEFQEEDEWLVQLLATHAATALTNAQLHAENMHALETASLERARFQALFKVSQAINSAVQLDEVISLIVDSAMTLSGGVGAAVYFLEHLPADDEESDQRTVPRFVARYAVGLDESLVAESARLPMVGSVAGRAVRTGETQVVADTAAEPGTVFPKLANASLRSLVAVPLFANGEMLGALSTYSDQVDGFDAESVQLVEGLASIASTALFNATLYEEAMRGREAAEREGQRLRELEQMKDEFLSTAAHELRTPLTTIRMSAGLAFEQIKALLEAGHDGVDRRLLDLVGLVQEGSERMQYLVNNLLDLTRLEQGKTTLVLRDVDLREVVNASVAATRPLFDSKDQTLSVHLPETYYEVKGDRDRLEQIIINLLSNAHKYSPSGSAIEVRVTRKGDECRVMVRDNGAGVPADERERIFERFYRSSLHRNDRTPSTGLGLPIARTLAEMHRGRLWVEEAPGGGSIFILALPVPQSATVPARAT